jgi:cbb3-type cytochrome oxidase subunit 3
MNPVFKDAAESAQLGVLMGLTTIQFLVVFVGAALWAFWPSRKGDTEAWARIPLEEDAK